MFEKLLSLFERLVAAAEKIAGSAGTPAHVGAAAGPANKPARGKATAAKETPPATDDISLDTTTATDDDFLGDGATASEKKYTRDEVRAALVGHGQRHKDPAKARAVLKSAGGVEILADLKEEKFAAVVEAANK
jgi:hypothetical protein